jgi:hypothetical protein
MFIERSCYFHLPILGNSRKTRKTICKISAASLIATNSMSSSGSNDASSVLKFSILIVNIQPDPKERGVRMIKIV